MSNCFCKTSLCLWIYLSFKTHVLVKKPSLTTPGQNEVSDHQYSFYNTYRFLYHENQKKYHIQSLTLVLTRYVDHVVMHHGDTSTTLLELTSPKTTSVE